jgi:flagella basal body P-ring formation protein FlgA
MMSSQANRGVLMLAAAALILISGAPAHATQVAHTVFVPRNVIYPGDVITADALVERTVQRDGDSPVIFGENPRDLVGKVARRTLMRGELVPSSAVHQQDVIVQGRPYKITYDSPYVSIVGVGIPLQSGAVGEMISVRNPSTGIIIKARVQPDHTLTVDEQ